MYFVILECGGDHVGFAPVCPLAFNRVVILSLRKHGFRNFLEALCKRGLSLAGVVLNSILSHSRLILPSRAACFTGNFVLWSRLRSGKVPAALFCPMGVPRQFIV